jgi:hypothetical protein
MGFPLSPARWAAGLLCLSAAASAAQLATQQQQQQQSLQADYSYIDVADPNWFFSAYNWFESTPSCRATTNPGALFKLGFWNSTAITVLINTTRLRGGPTWPTVKLGYSIDDQPWEFVLLGSVNGTSADPVVQLRVPVPINPTHEGMLTQHDLVVKVWASVQLCDRWNGGTSTASAADASTCSSYVTSPPPSKPLCLYKSP